MDMITLAMAKAYSDQKGGYIEPSKEILNFPLSDGANFEATATGNELTVGETYTCITESGSYTAVCKDFNGDALLGNITLLNPSGDNTGESFCVYIAEDDAGAFAVAIDQNGGSYIKVTTAETIHPIDPKYLPGVCLPVVELSTVATADLAQLSDEEAALFDALVGQPCVIKCVFDFSGISCNATVVASAIAIDGGVYGYTGVTILGRIIITNEDGYWGVQFSTN